MMHVETGENAAAGASGGGAIRFSGAFGQVHVAAPEDGRSPPHQVSSNAFDSWVIAGPGRPFLGRPYPFSWQ